MLKLVPFAVILAIFLYFASPGLFYYFDADDVMNLRRTWPDPIWKDVPANFSLSSSRALVSLIYRLLYAVAGFNPFPYHLFCLILLLTNIYLLYCVAHQVTQSREIASFAALLGCFHSRMDTLYIDTGNMYDIVCYTFVMSALLYYMRTQDFGLRQTLILMLLYFCALNAKEMAATLPAVLIAYELVYRGPVGRRNWQRWRTVAILGLMSAVFMLPKLTANSPLTQTYQPHYSLQRVLDNWQSYLGDMFYLPQRFPLMGVFLLLALMCTAALLFRSKPLTFACCFILLTPLPICFIDHRGLYVFYIPFAGWAIYGATLLFPLSRAALPEFPFPRVITTAVFMLTAAFLAGMHYRDRSHPFSPNSGKNLLIRTFVQQVVALCPAGPRSSRTLFLNDPFDADEYTPISALQLYFGDPKLEIQRKKMPEHQEFVANVKYDLIFDYRQDRVVLVKAHGACAR